MKRETQIPWAVLIATLFLAASFIGCQDSSTPADPNGVDLNPIQYPSGAYKYIEIDKVNGQVGGRLQLGSVDFNGDANFMISSNGEAGDGPVPISNPQGWETGEGSDPISFPVDWGFYEADEDGSLLFEGTKGPFEGRFNSAADLIITPRILGIAGSEGFGVGIKNTPPQLVLEPVQIVGEEQQFDGGPSLSGTSRVVRDNEELWRLKYVRDMEGTWGVVGIAHGYGGEVEAANFIIGTLTIDQSHSFNTFSSLIWCGDGNEYTDEGQLEVNEDGTVDFDVNGFGMDFVAFPNQSDSIFTAYAASNEKGIEQRLMAVAVKLGDQHPLPDEGSYHIYRFVENLDGSNVALDEGFLSFGPDSSFQVDCGEVQEEGRMVVDEAVEEAFILHVVHDQWGNENDLEYAGVLDASGDVILLSTLNNARGHVTFMIGFRVR